VQTILIVDDAPDLQKYLKRLLNLKGYHVQVADHGLQALEILRSSPALPNLILLDLMMPVMDGFEFRRVQLREPNFKDVPVLVLTADGLALSRLWEFDLSHYLLKPFPFEKLFSMIEEILAA